MELRANGKGHALIAACPGAGKTRFTVAAWEAPAISNGADVIVIVVPSRALKRQWKKAFERSGIGAIDDIANEHLEARAYRDDEMFDPNRPVQVYTYAQIAANPDLFRILCAKHRVFVVFDEIHHADDEAAFGQALRHSFEGAEFRMSLSGTPFNTKGGQLAFCETIPVTDDQGRRLSRTLADVTYSYGEALGAEGTEDDPRVVRPVQFVRWNGTAKWQRVYTDTGVVVERSVSGRCKTDQLWPLLDMDEGENAKKMIDAAIARLTEIREYQSNAGMLITAIDRDHCESIAQYLRSKGVKDCHVIVHDTPRAAEAIKAFENSSDRVLIAIKMISEGVDIKRLRVGVYASNVLTQMFFIQFIGRFIRWDGSLTDSQFACVFIPEHVTLIKYALEIERMVIEAEDAIDDDDHKGPPPPTPPPGVNIGLQSSGQLNGIIERHDEIGRSETELLRDALRRAGLHPIISEGQAKKLADAFKSMSPVMAAAMAEASEPSMPESTVSKKNDQLVAAIVREAERRGMPIGFKEANNAANRAVGINAKDVLTPEDVLHRRLEFLKGWLVSLRNPKDAA
jgi:superfamily II DNA or RNA helicase